MKKYGIGNEYTADLYDLWKTLTKKSKEEGEIILNYGWLRYTRENETDYYDLINGEGIVCCDGECCKILYEDDNLVKLIVPDIDIEFKMGHREAEIALKR